MKSKTFIERTYEQMKKANVVRSSEDFSTDYLGKSKSYYRAMKSQGLGANTAMLTRLANEMHKRRVLFEKVGSGQIAFHYVRLMHRVDPAHGKINRSSLKKQG